MSRRIYFKLCLVFVVMFVYAAADLTFSGVGAQQDQRPASQQPAQPEDKPAEQVYKNIQVMKGVPASRLMPAMSRLTQFLGVDCAYCHVPDALDKDDKPAKQTARKMFELVRTINATLNTNSVTCYTCHRGQPRPASMPPAPANAPPKSESAPPEIKPADAKANVDAILDHYIQSLGGKAALERVKTRVMTGTMVTQGGMKAPLEVYEKAPNKTLTIFRAPHGVNQMGFNGAIGWTKTPEQGLREEAGEQLDFIKSEAEFHKGLKLKNRYSRLTLLGQTQLDNREAYVIEASSPRGQPEKLYFDRQSGVLVRQDRVMERGQEKMLLQIYFEDYRTVDGVKLPFAIRRARPNFTWTYQFDEIKLNAPLDDAKFNKPAAP
ncbi:MAG: photosynthetic reaction center cytochrome c subunit family protein [Blastocatellia bacterium]